MDQPTSTPPTGPDLDEFLGAKPPSQRQRYLKWGAVALVVVVLLWAASKYFGGGAEEVRSQTYRLWGNREWVKVLTSQVALDWVRRYLLGLDPLESNFNRRVPRRA